MEGRNGLQCVDNAIYCAFLAPTYTTISAKQWRRESANELGLDTFGHVLHSWVSETMLDEGMRP
jgi:hypothetical protein